jgi:hypothetical protein
MYNFNKYRTVAEVEAALARDPIGFLFAVQDAEAAADAQAADKHLERRSSSARVSTHPGCAIGREARGSTPLPQAGHAALRASLVIPCHGSPLTGRVEPSASCGGSSAPWTRATFTSMCGATRATTIACGSITRHSTLAPSGGENTSTPWARFSTRRLTPSATRRSWPDC